VVELGRRFGVPEKQLVESASVSLDTKKWLLFLILKQFGVGGKFEGGQDLSRD